MMILAVCIINQSISQSINQATLLTKGSGITDIVIRTQIYNRIQLRQTDIEVCTKGSRKMFTNIAKVLYSVRWYGRSCRIFFADMNLSRWRHRWRHRQSGNCNHSAAAVNTISAVILTSSHRFSGDCSSWQALMQDNNCRRSRSCVHCTKWSYFELVQRKQ